MVIQFEFEIIEIIEMNTDKAQQMVDNLNEMTNGEELDNNHETHMDDQINQMQNDYYEMNR